MYYKISHNFILHCLRITDEFGCDFREPQLLLLDRFTGPVSFHRDKDFLGIEWPGLVIHDLALPPHPIGYGLGLHQNIDGVANYRCPFGP